MRKIIESDIDGLYSKQKLNKRKLKLLQSYDEAIKIIHFAIIWHTDYNQILRLGRIKDYITEMTLEDLQR